jgi:hypothetical protein
VQRSPVRDVYAQRVQELAGGLWTWTAPHPAWQESDDWGPEVRSYALQHDEGVILFDPVSPPAELTGMGRVEIVLTAPWHSRSAADLDAPLRADDLPAAVNAQPAFFPDERTLWIPAPSALVVGDSLPGGEAAPDEWLGDSTRDDYNAKLRPLLDLPIELLLPTHGDPITEDAHARLERALG